MEMQRQLRLIDRLPERIPHRVPHRRHVPRAAELDALHALLRDAADFPGGAFDVVVRQAGQPDHPVRVVAGETGREVVVMASISAGAFGVFILAPAGRMALMDSASAPVPSRLLTLQWRFR